MGTFDTNEEAALVNKTSRQNFFDDFKEKDMTDEEIGKKVKKAREAAVDTVSKFKGINDEAKSQSKVKKRATTEGAVLKHGPKATTNSPKDTKDKKKPEQSPKLPSGLRRRPNGRWVSFVC